MKHPPPNKIRPQAGRQQFNIASDAVQRDGAGSGSSATLYDEIYALVRLIPPGSVCTYGQIAAMIGKGGPRQVGYAMAALPPGSDVPWQRVINREGRVSPRKNSGCDSAQRKCLEAEGVFFDATGRVDLDRFGWSGPDWDWLADRGYTPVPPPRRR